MIIELRSRRNQEITVKFKERIAWGIAGLILMLAGLLLLINSLNQWVGNHW